MKVLLDSCVWKGALAALESAGHEVEWVGAWSNDPGDQEILDRADQRGAVIVTLDKDFGELAVLRNMTHAGIVRLVSIPARRQGDFAAAVLEKYGAELSAGAVITAEPGRVRVRPRSIEES